MYIYIHIISNNHATTTEADILPPQRGGLATKWIKRVGHIGHIHQAAPGQHQPALSDVPFSESLAGCKVMTKSPRIRCSRQKVHSLQGLQLLATCSDGLAFPAFQNYPIEAQQSSFHQSKQANKDTQWGVTRNNETSYSGRT